MIQGSFGSLDKLTQQTIRELTIDLCVQAIQARYKGDNAREDVEIRACVNTLKRLKELKVQ